MIRTVSRGSKFAGLRNGVGSSLITAGVLGPRTRIAITILPYSSQEANLIDAPQRVRQHKRYASTTAAPALELTPNEYSDLMRCYSSDYLDGLYLQWKRSPRSVDASWREYFDQMQADSNLNNQNAEPLPKPDTRKPIREMTSDTSQLAKVQLLVRAYQDRGHQIAKIDPLDMRDEGCTDVGLPAELTIAHYGFTQADLDRTFPLGPALLPRFVKETPSMTLRDIIGVCERIYCGSYGVEYLHISDREKCDWIRDRIEIPNAITYTREEKLQILDRLTWSSTFEQFMATKYPNRKRYGLEGGESLTPGFKALVDRAADKHGVNDIVVGMQHRGRMSIMSNVTRKPNEALFYEFSTRARAAQACLAGDVHNHLGWDHERVTPSGNHVNLSILANPSHLEADDPVAAGKTRAIQDLRKDYDKRSTMCLTVHGDAAIAGQGVVYETFGLNNLHGYSVGGTVHIVVNNQIGFTTDPKHSRSTPYCTDIAKAFDAPIFHVNADDIEAVYFFCQLAADWRAKFQTDCVVDLVCYRKFGHNEMDQPMFTQPKMYDRIAKQIPVYEQYVEKLVSERSFSRDEISKIQTRIWAQMEKSFETSKSYEPDGSEEIIAPAWRSQKTTAQLADEILLPQPTATTRAAINQIKVRYKQMPGDIISHRNVQKVIDSRIKALESGEDINWSTAEALAFGTLCMEGNNVRISGQDVQRGTFSQRHAIIHNQIQGMQSGGLPAHRHTWSPLDCLTSDQGRFTAVNSPLGEFGVLGFEYGYSLATPRSLVMWEAQFGDFANNTQCIIDNFIASGETKWMQRSGLVLSLPHGYDGQGPEHSSARIERFLQLCNEDSRRFPKKIDQIHQACNMQVVYMTTPANLFHALRRQVHRDFRKPLIILFSKSLLRHPKTKSQIGDFIGNSKFQHVIRDPAHASIQINAPNAINRVILCSGQVYAALEDYRTKHKITDTSITRIEQLHPFPWSRVRDILNEYSNATEVIWCQEEPMNGGPWHFIQGRVNTTLQHTKNHRDKTIQYVGRDPGASTATAFRKTHTEEEEVFVRKAFSSLSN